MSDRLTEILAEDQVLLELLRSFMDGEAPRFTVQDILWERVYERSLMHHVLPMAYEAAFRSTGFGTCRVELRQLWKRQTLASVMSQMQRTSRFLEIYKKMEKEGLQVLVVKGLICRQLYYKPDHRSSSDEDLYVSSRDFLACHRLLLAEGLQADGGPKLEEGFRADGGSKLEGGLRADGGPKLEEGLRADGGPKLEGGLRADGGPKLEEGFRAAGEPDREEELHTDGEPDRGNGDVISYQDPLSGLHIELHRQLFSEESRAYGGFNRMFADALDNHVVQVVEGVPVRTMCPTDHMLFLICHSLKHFLHSGFGIRQVCDMVMFANANGSAMDWHYIMKKLRQIHGDVFWLNLVAIGEQYLGFSREQACFSPETYWEGEAQADPGALLEDILEAGVFGKSTENRVHSSNITLDAYAEHRSSLGGSLRGALFPGRRYLARRYPTLERAPVLLPVMWAHRLLSYGAKLLPGRKSSVSMTGSLAIGSRRIELMKQYGIIEEKIRGK